MAASVPAARAPHYRRRLKFASENSYELLCINAWRRRSNSVLLTNFADEGYRRSAERLGARGFFDKSTEVDRLRQALVQVSA